jgi:hypothetical protein
MEKYEYLPSPLEPFERFFQFHCGTLALILVEATSR